MSKYKKLSKEDLLKLVEKQEKELKSKKYGLVWDSEREPEQVVLDCENNLPVLKRVKGKEIRTVDEDDNILIEGDNYHALTVLNYTHKEKIDVIYIDPPYNTGNKDFIYNDRYVDKEDGFRHSKWLNFMEKRLNLAKDLLKETGVIFISIDDNEQAQLKLLCDRIFGEENFVASIPWKGKGGGADNKYLMVAHEYILCFAKNKKDYVVGEQIRGITGKFNKYDEEKQRRYKTQLVRKWGSNSRRVDRPNLYYGVIAPDGVLVFPILPSGEDGCWRWSKNTLDKEAKNGNVEFVKNNKKWILYEKIYEPNNNEILTRKYSTWFDSFGNTAEGSKKLFDIFGSKEFDYPKPLKLLKALLRIGNMKEDSMVLDFMAGSGTTGHAVLDLNKEDGGNRKFILCTNNELNGLEKELKEKGMSEKEIDEHGICRRVCYPRLEKVIKGYKNSKGAKIDGLGGNLQYFRTDLVKKTKNKDQVRINLTQKCTEMLCVKENIFNLDTKKEDYKIFSSNKKDRFMCVYYNFLDDSFDDFLKEIKKLKGEKIIYMFSIDGKTDAGLFSEIENFKIEEIPQKILDIYKQLVKMNIPVKAENIFSDFEKAKTRIFEEKEKDDGARILRVVIEKVVQKIAQNNGINILKNDAKEEKLSILNDKLKSDNIFSKVEWEENKTYIAIGNHAAHGEYLEYNLKNTENFYKHIGNLIEKHNLK